MSSVSPKKKIRPVVILAEIIFGIWVLFLLSAEALILPNQLSDKLAQKYEIVQSLRDYFSIETQTAASKDIDPK